MHRRPRAVLASLALALVTLFAALPVAPAAVVAAPDEPPDATYFRTMSANYGISVFLRGRADALQTLQGAQAAGFVWQKKHHSTPTPDQQLSHFLAQVDVVVNGECT